MTHENPVSGGDLARVARDAAGLVEANGLCKQDFYPIGYDGEVADNPAIARTLPLCAMGALRIAADPYTEPSMTDHAREVETAFADHLALRYGIVPCDELEPHHLAISRWSDDPARSAGEVAAELRAFADETKKEI